MVRLPILTLLLLLAGPAMAAEPHAASKVPHLDIQKGCNAAGKLETTDIQPVQACVAQEMDTRAKLEKQWTSFPASYRTACIEETNIGGDPSYVEVLTCLEMKRDAATPTHAPAPGGQAK